MQLLVQISGISSLYTLLHKLSSSSENISLFHNFPDTLSSPEDFLFVTNLRQVCSSSEVKFSVFIGSSAAIVVVIGESIIVGGCPRSLTK